MKLKDQILAAAVRRAKLRGGLNRFTREQVASDCKCSEAIVSYHYGTMKALRDAVVQRAIVAEIVEILAQATYPRHPSLHYEKLSVKLRTSISAYLVG